MRRLLLRVPKAGGSQRRERLVAEAKRRGKEVSEVPLVLADWTILLTDVPAKRLSLVEALVLLRERGPMELLYKLHLLDLSPNFTLPQRVDALADVPMNRIPLLVGW
jgi:hypothetical protein